MATALLGGRGLVPREPPLVTICNCNNYYPFRHLQQISSEISSTGCISEERECDGFAAQGLGAALSHQAQRPFRDRATPFQTADPAPARRYC
jgi:hypothetical protein